MSKYRITLMPIDKFFFGGDMTFQVGNNEKDSFNQQYSSYIIQSSMFPQQTSLLGMLRFLILRNADKSIFAANKIVDKKAAAALIGGSSFKVNNDNEKNSFGVIKGISRVGVLRDGKELVFAPLFGKISFDNNAQEGSYNFGKLKVPHLTKDQYDAKDGLEILLIEKKDIEKYFGQYESISSARKAEKKKDKPILTKPPYQMGDIFIQDRRIGIARSIQSGKTDDGALFKQISYRFNDDAKYSFVFEAEVEGVELKDFDGHLVTVGGDNSQFIINISDDLNNEAVISENSHCPAITLLSPTFLKRSEVLDNTIFAVTRLMPFRFLTSVMEKTESYHILSGNLTRSDRYELYAPGTVFYFESVKQRESFVKALESKKDFRQIGYNDYILLN